MSDFVDSEVVEVSNEVSSRFCPQGALHQPPASSPSDRSMMDGRLKNGLIGFQGWLYSRPVVFFIPRGDRKQIQDIGLQRSPDF